jgi:hypothetical protein
MPATVAVNLLGNPETANDLRTRLQKFMDQYPGEWNVGILRSQTSTIWEITVRAPDGRREWVHKLYGEDSGHNLEMILTEVGRIAEGKSHSGI